MNCLEWLIEILQPAPKPQPKPPLDTTAYSFEQELLEAYNKERLGSGLKPLRLNHKLNSAAVQHAVWMASNNKLSHEGKNGSSVGNRIRSEGYSWWICGENIANGYQTVQAVMNGWISSKGHRENILGNFTEAGFGAVMSKGKMYWTADLARPKLSASDIEAAPVLSGALAE